MPGKQTLRRRWSTAARWPFGIAYTSWRYLWSTTPIHRWELSGNWADDAPPELPEGTDRSKLQTVEDGVGPLVHRIYRTRMVGSPMSSEKLMARIQGNLDCIAPKEFATFQKEIGTKGSLTVGDEYVVRMPGPWDGPVRVVSVDPTSFRLATLDGHLEAGQIEFRAGSDYRSLWFDIEAWARSGDRLSDLFYTHLRISKEVQMHMWCSVLASAVTLARARMEGGIVVTTRLISAAALERERGRKVEPYEDRHLAALSSQAVNFDASKIGDYTPATGWRVDDMVESLPNEGSGPPEERGPWNIAREIMIDYQLADPGVVTATSALGAPLAGRDMLLTIRYGPLRFRVGVRVGEVYEETVEVDRRPVHLFGWYYRTLDGHFEQGQMHYEIWKWLETGDVEFHLRAVSKPAERGPFLPRTGFRLFGRTRQLRFYRQACRRIRRLTETQLETERAAEGPGPARRPKRSSG
jgi:uncharacterized protein (UPF0548 family)